MKTKTAVWILVIVAVILVIWYFVKMKQPAAPTDTGTAASTSTTAGTPAAPSLLNVAQDATLGNYLTAQNGMTLYAYTKDSAGVSNCTGSCLATWPPYTVTSTNDFTAAPGITGAIGSITRSDGTMQVTYNGIPLYFYQGDSAPGNTNGQNLGGVWFVVPSDK